MSHVFRLIAQPKGRPRYSNGFWRWGADCSSSRHGTLSPHAERPRGWHAPVWTRAGELVLVELPVLVAVFSACQQPSVALDPWSHGPPVVCDGSSFAPPAHLAGISWILATFRG